MSAPEDREVFEAWMTARDGDFTHWELWQAAAAAGQAAAERLQRENQELRTVMIAAAEEIHAHWDAHCDAEGYGPANLMRRLEEGIPSRYAYTVGDFAVLKAERDQARAQVERAAQLLSGIHVLLYPPPVTTAEGVTMVFRPEDPHAWVQNLSDRIRALPDELEKLRGDQAHPISADDPGIYEFWDRSER